MISSLFIANSTSHNSQIREIFWEYLQWVNGRIYQEYGVDFDIQSILENDMLELGKFMPPRGRLLFTLPEHRPGGMACLKPLEEDIGEIKRMYVRPEYRRQGLGKGLLVRLFTEARQIGYRKLRLDSANFMTEAHRLYRSSGFKDISAYPGSEIPADYQKNWVFMEKDLSLEG